MNPFIRLIRYFLLGSALGIVVTLVGTVFFFPFKLALIMSLIFGFIYGLFSMGFMVRTLKVIEFEINMQNKDPQKGFHWYKEELTMQMKHMHFKHEDRGSIQTYLPCRLYKIYESPVVFTYDAYSIHIRASRMMMRILLDVVEMKR